LVAFKKFCQGIIALILEMGFGFNFFDFLSIASRKYIHICLSVKITSTDNFIIKMEKLLVIWVIVGLYYI